MLNKPCKADLEIDSVGNLIQIRHRGFSHPIWKPINILKPDLLNISFERGGGRSLGKAAAGAVIGGVLTGGVGLLVGGLLGGRKKDKSEIYITYLYSGKEFCLVLKTGKHTNDIYAAITSLFA